MSTFQFEYEKQLEAKDQRIAELEANGFDFCEQCNTPLSQCGPLGPDGIPTLDCIACKLRQRIAELERALADERFSNSGYLRQWKELAALLDRVPHQYYESPVRCDPDCPACAWQKLKANNL